MELDNLEKNKPARNEKGQLLPGNTANPFGRPKGQSLKEYWRKRFAEMTDEEKAEFSQKVGVESIWRMAEGNPHSETSTKLDGSITLQVIQFNGDNKPSLPMDAGEAPASDSGQSVEIQGDSVAS